jgi:hypothetical protein
MAFSPFLTIELEQHISLLLLGGIGIVATAPVAAAGLLFLASVAMALPTVRSIQWELKSLRLILRRCTQKTQSGICVFKKVVSGVGSRLCRY